jgi:O-acetyl-ADP-ribose deacetylase (regulator of RNase III)
MKIILSAIQEPLLNAWKEYFEGYSDVSIVEGDITQLTCDAVVSPANSFGFMDGGLDLALSNRYGWHIQDELQKIIKELPEGELLVGRAIVLETNDEHVPYLISAPTMRIPTNFQIPTSINAYLAMKAALIVAKEHEQISSVAIPGLCTGTGGMKAETAANQMFTAYKEIILGEQMDFPEYGDAQRYHWKLNEDGLIWTH